jgi:hypothetical protein
MSLVYEYFAGLNEKLELIQMRIFLIGVFVAATTLPGCSEGFVQGQSESDTKIISLPDVKIGSDYDHEREKITQEGWAMVPASCTESNLCLNYSELATNLDNGETCGHFTKGGNKIVVCVDVIPDGARLKSISRLR